MGGEHDKQFDVELKMEEAKDQNVKTKVIEVGQKSTGERATATGQNENGRGKGESHRQRFHFTFNGVDGCW